MSVFDTTEQLIPLQIGTSKQSAATTDAVLIAGSPLALPFDYEVLGISLALKTGGSSTFQNRFINAYVSSTVSGLGTVGTTVSTTASRLFNSPTKSGTIKYAKIDQAIATLAATPVSSRTATATVNTTGLTTDASTSIAIGQFVVGPGIVPGTKVASGSGTSWTLDTAVTAALSTTPIAFYDCPTALVTPKGVNYTGLPVQVAGITDSFWVNLNTVNNGGVFWKLLDVQADVNSVRWKVGPLPQSALYNAVATTWAAAGFWAFTTTDIANATQLALPYGSTLAAGTMQIVNACVVPAAAATTTYLSNISGAPDAATPNTAATYSVPVNFTNYGVGYKVKAGSYLALTSQTVNSLGVGTADSGGTWAADNEITAYLNIRKF